MPIKLNGATSGSVELDVPAAVGSDLQLTLPATAGEVIVKEADGSVDLGNVEIDSLGRLLMGTSTSLNGGSNQYSRVQVIGNHSGNPSPGYFSLGRAEVVTSMSNNDALGRFVFTDNAAGDFARIEGFVDDNCGTDNYPGRIVFSTTASGEDGPTERLRINRAGSIRAPGIYAETTASAVNVHVHSNGTLQRSTSSAKYKTNIETLEISYSDALLNCRPVWYRSTCETDNADYGWWGFIAEEVAEIDPRLVHWKTLDITYDEEGSIVETPCAPEPEGVAYERFVPHLLNLIKRQQTAIETLEQRLSDAGIA